MRRAAILAAIVTAVLAGCGTGTHPRAVSSATECNPANYAMNCVRQTPTLGTAPAPVVAYGIDFAWSCPNPGGHAFGASYLSHDPSKNWTQRCVDAYHAAGARTVAVWETTATRALSGFAAGQSDARLAAAQAAALGEPVTRPIYFAIDFDETPGQAPAVAAYFRGVGSVLGVARTGGYGGYWVVKRLFDAGLIRYGWQTYAWSGGRWDPRAQLQQYLNAAQVDYDRAVAADYGQWPYTAPRPARVRHSARWRALHYLIGRHCDHRTHRFVHACRVWRAEFARAR